MTPPADTTSPNYPPLLDPTTRTRLQAQFATSAAHQHADKWEELWKQEFTPWDKGTSNPALADLLDGGGKVSGAGEGVKGDGEGKKGKGRERKRALVAGCGKGYDILLLSSHGYDAYGLDISSTALSHARTNASQPSVLSDPIYAIRDATLGKGVAKFIHGDFFGDGWKGEVVLGKGEEWDGTFDVIYDFTFLCALPPSLRSQWALRYSQLLSQTGHLICIEFPATKDETSGGPPWALPPKVHMAHLRRPGVNLEYAYDKSGVETEERWVLVEERLDEKEVEEGKFKGLVRVDHFQPERTHDMGYSDKGEVDDWVGIWRHRGAA